MKTLLFFDVDGTLFDNEQQKVSIKTLHAIQKLTQDERYLVGLATGRSMDQLDAISEIKDAFDLKILINGAVAYYKNEFIYGKPMEKQDCEAVLKYANRIHVGIGFIGKNGHAISLLDDVVRLSLKDYQMSIPPIDPLYYLNEDIYQIWVFSNDKTTIQSFKDKFSNLKLFPWHKDGADLVHKDVSKGEAIKHIKATMGIDKVIAFGDGENDVEMIEVADIGVAMGNSRSVALKNKATFVTDHVGEEGLYNAIIKLNLL
jgi:Cof subfamily protein (haloacid dehalogenase superfamily)